MNEQNTTPPDMIQQAGELLRRFQMAEQIVDWEFNGTEVTGFIAGESAIVIASAVLAVAGELRELRNVLAMAMSEGSNMNGEPISSLRIDTGA